MKNYYTLFLLLLLWCCSSVVNAQETTTLSADELDIQVTYAQKIGKTLPLRHLVPMLPADPGKRQRVKMNKQGPQNFAGRGKYVSSNPNALPQGEDPVWQRSMRSSSIDVEPLVNIEGLDTGSSPQDPTGDIGKDYYMQALNATLIGLYDKEGNLIADFTANTIWNSIGFSSAGDPIILYDQEAQRWIITEFPSGNQLLVAISETSDPMGAYSAYNFGTPSFPDYPKYGIWSNAYSVTTNESGPSNLPCYFINRDELLNEENTVSIQRIVLPGIGSGPGFQVATPVDWTGLTPPEEDAPIIMTLNDDAWGASAQDQIDIHTFNIDWTNPGNTTITTTNVVTAPYDTNPCSVSGGGFSCIPQLNGGGLDGLPEVIMNQVHYRNFGSYEAMVLNFITDVTGGDNLSGIRWMELRRTAGEDWSVYQEGTYAPEDGLDRFMGSICMDGAGNIGLAYAVSSEEIYAGLRFTGRRASDPLGEMTVNEYTIVDGQSTLFTGTRFGDYAHMSVDPGNDRTFWFTAEYAGANGNATRIVAFELRRDTTDIAPIALNKPESGPQLSDMEAVEVVVQNLGLDTPMVFQVGYIFEDEAPVFDEVTYTLYPDSTYTHTFIPTVDMSVVGDYDFKVFTTLEGDQAILNDTLRAVRSNLPRFDVTVSAIDGLGELICADSIEIAATITNLGTEPLTSATIVVVLNGNTLTTINWTGNLLPGESEQIGIGLDGLVDGTNEVVISASNPNGEADEIPGNDSLTRPFEAQTDGAGVRLLLLTDEYPGETTWELADETGTVIYEGGPYNAEESLIIEEFCLDSEACYSFTIFDSFGDGICCEYGLGNYSIVDADGLPLLVSTGEFSFEETNQFCATFSCLLDAQFDVSPVSGEGANDGAMLITAINGIAPVQYSIDGGESFSDNNLFTDLAPGEYEIVILDGANCEFTSTVTVPECVINAMAEVTDATEGNSDGTIIVAVVNAALPITYSIDNGITFQEDPVFDGLPNGNYTILVVDGLGCAIELDVTVGVISSTNTLSVGQLIEVFPNPTDGVFSINIKGLNQANHMLKLEIINAEGKLVQVTNLTRYNDVFTGQVSLYNYPDGVYFVRFNSDELDRMVRVVKQ